MSPVESTATTARGPVLERRDEKWALRHCARTGHVRYLVDDHPVRSDLERVTPQGLLVRCLRCGAFVEAGDDLPEGPLAAAPVVAGSAHLRRLALVRVLAAERIGRGVVFLLAAALALSLVNRHSRLFDGAVKGLSAAGLDVRGSRALQVLTDLLNHTGRTYAWVAVALTAYAALQVVEGAALWSGRRWGEYLSVVATAAFVPLEIFELFHHFTLVKGGALIVNLVAVGYLVYKGRLFGVRGGHPAAIEDERASGLLARLTGAADRPADPVPAAT